MNSATAFRILILVIPVVWVVIRLVWTSVEPHARQNWDEGIMGLWSQHRSAVLYGWEQGLKINGE